MRMNVVAQDDITVTVTDANDRVRTQSSDSNSALIGHRLRMFCGKYTENCIILFMLFTKTYARI